MNTNSAPGTLTKHGGPVRLLSYDVPDQATGTGQMEYVVQDIQLSGSNDIHKGEVDVLQRLQRSNTLKKMEENNVQKQLEAERAEKELDLVREQQKLNQYSNYSLVNNHMATYTDVQSDDIPENPLLEGIDQDIQYYAEEARQMTRSPPTHSDDEDNILSLPYDPNLVCPKCGKRYRIGQIQRFKRHAEERCPKKA